MTTAAWPASVNSDVLVEGFGEQRESNRIDFSPEVGRPIRRRRASRSDRILPCKLWVTSDEFDDLDRFYNTRLSDGIEPFTWIHPRTKVAATFQFEGEPPKIITVFGEHYQVQFAMRLLSGGTAPPALKFNRASNSQYLMAL